VPWVLYEFRKAKMLLTQLVLILTWNMDVARMKAKDRNLLGSKSRVQYRFPRPE